jgi:hypothetical protein
MFVVWGQYAGPLELGSTGQNDNRINKHGELICTPGYGARFCTMDSAVLGLGLVSHIS